MKQAAAKGSTAKHAGTHKHAGTSKHHPSKQPAGAKKAPARSVHTKAKHPAHAKARQLSPGDVACCSAEALAASLRLAGRVVGADDVLALYWATAATPDAGAPVLATLDVATEAGFAGVRPRWFAELPLDLLGEAAEVGRGIEWGSVHALILGLELPEGPHAVCASPAGWWSWGGLWEFPGAVVEEAWVVTWP
jgi:hypothetical protein